METSLTFGNSIKIDSFSNHTLEVQPVLSGLQFRRGLRKRCSDRWSNPHEALTDWRLYWGQLESLAFRIFDKMLIIGHWLSKTLKLSLASGALLLKILLLYPSNTIFKTKKYFPKMFSNGFPKIGFKVFSYI